MKKNIILFFICVFGFNTFGQAGSLEYKGEYASSVIGGYVRDAVFAHDTCYFISGDGNRILMKRTNGGNLVNPFDGKVFHEALKLCINNSHIIVLDLEKIRIYTKSGVLVRQIQLLQGILYYYFWVKGTTEIMLMSHSKVFVYNYNTGQLVAQKESTCSFDLSNFANNGQKFFYGGDRLMSYEYKNNAIIQTDITTIKYSDYYSRDFHLASCVNNQMLWFDFYKRDTLFVTDANFNAQIATYPFFPISEKPTSDELYTESGDPNLDIIPSQYANYVIKISENKIKFYQLTL